MVNLRKKLIRLLLIILFIYCNVISSAFAQSPCNIGCPSERCEEVDPPSYCLHCQETPPIPECLPPCEKRQPPTAVEMVLDSILLRPLSFAAIIAGGALYIVTLPFSAMSGNSREVAQQLIGKPMQFTFNRRLGDIPINEEY